MSDLISEARKYAKNGSYRREAMRDLMLELADALEQAQATANVDERVAQLQAHRACGNEEHDPQNGKISGFCVVCLTTWPCEIHRQLPTEDSGNG